MNLQVNGASVWTNRCARGAQHRADWEITVFHPGCKTKTVQGVSPKNLSYARTLAQFDRSDFAGKLASPPKNNAQGWRHVNKPEWRQWMGVALLPDDGVVCYECYGFFTRLSKWRSKEERQRHLRTAAAETITAHLPLLLDFLGDRALSALACLAANLRWLGQLRHGGVRG